MPTVITCYYRKKLGHKVRDCKRKLGSEFEMEKSGKFNDRRKKKWCSYRNNSGQLDKKCYQQMEKLGKFDSRRMKNGVATITLG